MTNFVMDVFNQKTRNRKMPVTIACDHQRKAHYVYALGFLFGGDFRVFYIGKTSSLGSRVMGHEKRESGSACLCLGFDSKAEADRAETVLIKRYDPRENLKAGNWLSSNSYAEELTNRNWFAYCNYETSGVKKYKRSELFDWSERGYPASPDEVYEYEKELAGADS